MARIKCNNCGTENDFFILNCIQCTSLIRARVVNIDLWHIIWMVIDSPKRAFQNIIHAEHKNFMILLGVLVSLKIYFDVQFTSNLVFSSSPDLSNMMLYLAGSILLFSILILLISYFMNFINSRLNIKTRFKDNAAMYIYSFLPLIFGLILLLPVEYALFGNHWLIFDPSPFDIKTSAAWILASIEIALHLWSVILTMVATYAYTDKKLYSILSGVIIHLMIYVVYIGTISLLIYLV